MKIYIAGKITGDPDYKKKFADAETALVRKGHSVMNPAWQNEGKEFNYADYMLVSEAMQKICNATVLLDDWKKSEGATLEHQRAILRSQKIYHGVDEVPDYNKKCYVVCNAEESFTLSRNECMEFLKVTDAELSRVIEKGTARRGYTVNVMEV